MRRGSLPALLCAIPTLFALGCPDDSAPVGDSGGATSSGDVTTSTSETPDTSSTGDDPTTTTTSTTVDPDSSSSGEPTAEGSSSTGLDGCGDGDIDPGELCDGDNLDGRDCASEDFVDGVLACNPDCTLDTSGCNYACGDGNVQGDEQCEGNDLDGADCVSAGFDGGDLGCNADCTFDTTACENYVCGDGVIAGPEACDGLLLAGEDCVSQGFDSGVLACAADCTAFDTTGCALCGDGVINGGEVCDGAALPGDDCVSLGLEGGVVSCAPDCTLDLSECTGCGNGDQDPGEECDGGDFGATTCVDLGFAGGQPGCTPACTITTDSCFGLHQYCTSPAAAIGPNAGAVTLSVIDIAGLAGEVIDVDVVVEATHALASDLDIQVRHVDTDTTVVLAQDQCMSADVDATFDQDAAGAPDCAPPVAIEGNVLPVGNLDTLAVAVADGNGSWELSITDDTNLNGGTLTQWCVVVTNEAGIPECSNGAELLAMNPAADQVVCDDPNDSTCEEDAESLCPVGWGLCSSTQHSNRNDAFDYPVDGNGIVVVGEIYCRGGNNGAGHHTLGPYDNISNLNQDAPVNCGYGSSRDSCPSGFGCNELQVQALCCAPDPLCGNGVVDGVEELCDDGNASDDDDCLNSCSWRVPAAQGMPGVGC